MTRPTPDHARNLPARNELERESGRRGERPTPETDQMLSRRRPYGVDGEWVDGYFARRLERQRDEAARLLRCLESLAALAAPDNHPRRQEARAFLAQVDKEGK